jgi:ubiquinone/menaquinone biosynthesis C-methylase UbiE
MDTTEHEARHDELRKQVHGMWSAVADGWREHADDADERGTAATEQLLDLAGLRPGDRVLELACGPGGAGLAAAARVGSSGEVVLTDVVPEMTAIAAERARARRLTNVRTAVLDLEEIDAPDESYDVVLCREGLMFATEPAQAVAEMRRVLRPGGRLALAVWGPRERNPWLGLVFDALTAQLGMPFPPPGVPGPFALGDANLLRALLSEPPMADVIVTECSVPLHAIDFDHWWTRTRALAGPLSMVVASLPHDVHAQLLDRLRDAVAPYETSDGLDLPGLSLLTVARRA